MGDPETQVVIPRIKNDLLDIIECFDNKLSEVKLDIKDGYTTTVILASEGYQESYEKGDTISNLEKNNSQIFHAGTINEDKKVKSNGGRVIACTGEGETIDEALENSYYLADKITWSNKYYRRDIGKDLK